MSCGRAYLAGEPGGTALQVSDTAGQVRFRRLPSLTSRAARPADAILLRRTPDGFAVLLIALAANKRMDLTNGRRSGKL